MGSNLSGQQMSGPLEGVWIDSTFQTSHTTARQGSCPAWRVLFTGFTDRAPPNVILRFLALPHPSPNIGKPCFDRGQSRSVLGLQVSGPGNLRERNCKRISQCQLQSCVVQCWLGTDVVLILKGPLIRPHVGQVRTS